MRTAPNGKPYAILLTTTDNVRFYLSHDGAVIDRSNGPRDWDYSGKWIVRGFLTRWNSSTIVPLSDALDGADIGHGYVVDLDHGTTRTWGTGSRVRSLAHVR